MKRITEWKCPAPSVLVCGRVKRLKHKRVIRVFVDSLDSGSVVCGQVLCLLKKGAIYSMYVNIEFNNFIIYDLSVLKRLVCLQRLLPCFCLNEFGHFQHVLASTLTSNCSLFPCSVCCTCWWRQYIGFTDTLIVFMFFQKVIMCVLLILF